MEIVILKCKVNETIIGRTGITRGVIELLLFRLWRQKEM